MSIRSKLIKVDSYQENQTSLYVKKGDIMSGYFNRYPKVGVSFQFFEDKMMGINPIYTTIVTEIIDDNTFKTKNSLYKIVTLEDEREDKIKLIID
jgi:hypothetical protein